MRSIQVTGTDAGRRYCAAGLPNLLESTSSVVAPKSDTELGSDRVRGELCRGAATIDVPASKPPGVRTSTLEVRPSMRRA